MERENTCKWYVYELIDPFTQTVFYVGKGSGDRIDQHEREADQGSEGHKCNRIRRIWEKGGEIIKRKVAYFWEERAAYAHEADRIGWYGIENLTNVSWSCGLVRVPDKGKDALSHLIRYPVLVAAWLKMTNGGKDKIRVNADPIRKGVLEGFFNHLAPAAIKEISKDAKLRDKFTETMRQCGLDLVWQLNQQVMLCSPQ